MRIATILAGFTTALVLSSAFAAPPDVRKIDTSGFDLGEVNSEHLESPIVIRSSDELYDVVADEMAFAMISQQIDFNSEILLYFKWTGSGEDTLKTLPDRNAPSGELTFIYQTGMTLELSPHHRMFAVPIGTTWRVEITMEGAAL